MNTVEYLLQSLGEELCETAQETSKCNRFGLLDVKPGGTLSNKARLELELSHVQAVIEVLQEEGVTLELDYEEVARKKFEIRRWMSYSYMKGTLQEEE